MFLVYTTIMTQLIYHRILCVPGGVAVITTAASAPTPSPSSATEEHSTFVIVFAVIGSIVLLLLLVALSQTCLFKHHGVDSELSNKDSDEGAKELCSAQQRTAVGLGDLERQLSMGPPTDLTEAGRSAGGKS
jgi:hypothetical protein